MDKAKVALIFYFSASFLYLIAVFFDWEILELISKPAIIPSIMMWYFFKIRRKFNVLFLISLLFFFLGDMLYMLDVEGLYSLGLFFFSIPYLFVIYFTVEDLKEITKNNKKTGDYSFVVILIILSGLLYTVLSFLEIKTQIEFATYMFMGVQLVLMGVLASLVYYNLPNRQSFFLALAVSAFIMSDLFFILNKNLHELLIFKMINTFTQSISYLFYVKFFIERNK